MTIKVLVKVDRILRVIADRPGVSFADLQVAVGLHKATLSNILKTLTDLGYAARTGDGGCRLGTTVLELAGGERLRRALPRVAEECARTLAEQLRETVTVGRLQDGNRFNLAKATVDRTVSVNAKVELRPSPYDTATGRVLLAFCTADEREQAIGRHGLPGTAWDGIDSREKLDRALLPIRAAGHAELARGDAHSLAVPACDADGRLVAAVGAAIPAFRFSAESRDPTLAVLRMAAEQMTHELELKQEDPDA